MLPKFLPLSHTAGIPPKSQPCRHTKRTETQLWLISKTESGPSATSHFSTVSHLTYTVYICHRTSAPAVKLADGFTASTWPKLPTMNPEELIQCWQTATEGGEVRSRDLWNLCAPQCSCYHTCHLTPLRSWTTTGHHHYKKNVSLTRIHSDLELTSEHGVGRKHIASIHPRLYPSQLTWNRWRESIKLQVSVIYAFARKTWFWKPFPQWIFKQYFFCCWTWLCFIWKYQPQWASSEIPE